MLHPRPLLRPLSNLSQTPSQTPSTPIPIPTLVPRLPRPLRSIAFAEECCKSSLVSKTLRIANGMSFLQLVRQLRSNSLARPSRGMEHQHDIDTSRSHTRVWSV